MVEPQSSWKRYFSWRFLSSKVREKGIIWCLKKAILKLLSLPLRVLYLPPAYLLYLVGVRFLPIFKERIGHVAMEPDCYLKEGVLGMRPQYFEVVLAPDPVANRHLLNYWQTQLRILRSYPLCTLLAPFLAYRFLRYDISRYAMTVTETSLYPEIQAKWGGRRPLLSLSETDSKKGWECLAKVGVPKDAWFVCIHSREPGYSPTDDDLHAYRNCEIDNYLLAVKAITARGGWCIRMGDPTMKKLPPMERVIDYAHRDDIRSDWMDVFLCASCRFFLGNTSGLCFVSSVFGVPIATANLIPISTLPFSINDLGIPKLLWLSSESRYLTFTEAFRSPVSNFRYGHLYDEAGVRVEENSAADIRDLSLEMLERTEGTIRYSEEDERLQARFSALLSPGHYSYGTRSRVGRDFLRKYASLLANGN